MTLNIGFLRSNSTSFICFLCWCVQWMFLFSRWMYLCCMLLHIWVHCILFVTIIPFHLYTAWGHSTRLNLYILLLSYVFIVSLLFLYGAGSSKAYSSIGVFNYFGSYSF
jgi:hypothetical protein